MKNFWLIVALIWSLVSSLEWLKGEKAEARDAQSLSFLALLLSDASERRQKEHRK